MCTFECKGRTGLREAMVKPTCRCLVKKPPSASQAHMPHLRERRSVWTRSPKAQEEHTARAQFRSFLSLPSLIYSAPATRANQPSRPREKEGEPCRVWEAIESIPGRLAPCRVENGGGRGNCSVKLGRVNMHVGSRSAAIGLDHARSPVPSKKSVLDKRHAPEKGGRREEGRHDGSRCEPSVPRTVR